ncbi:GTPase domain-containing protein [Sorangium sp. So ce1335]|uniref:GTPase domain-containing protein n=1 Tax=Sorangium sp. So ce1335 TaxID=3133335 RepID=UPI003F6246C8
MSPVVIILIALVATCVAGVLMLIGVRASKLARELEQAERKIESLHVENGNLGGVLAALNEEHAKAESCLEYMDGYIKSLSAELERRPKITRKTYRILTLGVKATGKTSLTLKWANPLIDLGTLEGTKFERYERTVSHVPQKDVVIEHVFEVHDWGGEHIVEAVQQLIVDEIHGVLIVVDLGGKEAKQSEQSRIQEQLQEFQVQVLKFLFAPKTLTSCKTVVLFINKSDLLAGTPAHVEEQAKKLYAPLLDNLNRFSTHVNVRVLVGSASYGHSTHLLFSHFVERILPKSAYDVQLLQRMKSEISEPRGPAPSERPSPELPAAAPAPEPAALTEDPVISVAELVTPPPLPGAAPTSERVAGLKSTTRIPGPPPRPPLPRGSEERGER